MNNSKAEKILLINKPKGWTSFDVVAKIRGSYKQQATDGFVNSESKKANSQKTIANSSRRIRVGHAGTLDPFATGLLIVLVGEATKKQDSFMKLDKEYIATLKLGATSTTGDPEGEIQVTNTTDQIPNEVAINEVLRKFKGEIEQVPPIFSAIKIDGQRAYKLARAGKEVEIKPRSVKIYDLQILSFEYPKLEILVKCSSGTYIRSLAKDIGEALGTGAYLTDLKRTKIGDFDLANAKTVEEIGFFS